MKSSNVFLDASVILSGLASPFGGSRKILEVGGLKRFGLIASALVIREVEERLPKVRVPLTRLKKIIENETIQVVEAPSLEFILKFTSLTIDPNDAHVLATAVMVGADFLVSLDKKHILTPKVKRFLSPIRVFSPQQFWRYLGYRQQ